MDLGKEPPAITGTELWLQRISRQLQVLLDRGAAPVEGEAPAGAVRLQEPPTPRRAKRVEG